MKYFTFVAVVLAVALATSPVLSADNRFQKGVDLYKQGKTAEGIAELKAAQEANPKDPQINSWLGYALLSTGKAADAITYLQAAAELTPGNLQTRINLGAAYLTLGKPDKAVPEFEAAVKLSPGSVEAHYNLANAYVRANKAPQGIAEYKAASELSPKDSTILCALAQEQQKSGDLKGAVDTLTKALAIKPDDVVIATNLGLAERKAGDLAGAEATLKAALPNAANYPLTHLALAEVYGAENRTDDAISEYQAVLASRPDDYTANHNLATIYSQRGDQAKAAEYYDHALRAKPTDLNTMQACGLAKVKAGNKEEGIKQLKQAAAQDPAVASGHISLATGYMFCGMDADAKLEWQEALKLDPENTIAKINLAGLMLRANKPDLVEAEKQFQIVLAKEPKNPQALLGLGLISNARGKIDDAMAFYNKAIESNPNYAEAYNNLGTAYEKKGDKQAALASYTKALELKPDYADAKKNKERLSPTPGADAGANS